MLVCHFSVPPVWWWEDRGAERLQTRGDGAEANPGQTATATRWEAYILFYVIIPSIYDSTSLFLLIIRSPTSQRSWRPSASLQRDRCPWARSIILIIRLLIIITIIYVFRLSIANIFDFIYHQTTYRLQACVMAHKWILLKRPLPLGEKSIPIHPYTFYLYYYSTTETTYDLHFYLLLRILYIA